jgi:DNA helicase-2/ATP-dependent DNA helicase PcrA
MARLLETYEECKTQRGVIDFEDVLLLTAGILAERDEIARTVRGQYRHFVVDEYQDVNTLQQRLLDLWLGERDDVCVVGDPAQTIYSFTGASPDHLLRFPRRYPSAQVVRLVRNYRSTPQIVALANLVSRAAAVRSDRARATPPAAYVELVSDSPAGPDPTLRQHADDPAEAAWIADEIAGMVGRGHPASEIAVLMRTNAQSEAFEAALRRPAFRTWCAAANGSSPARRCGRASCCCAPPPAATTGRCRFPTSCATSSAVRDGRPRPQAPEGRSASGGSH